MKHELKTIEYPGFGKIRMVIDLDGNPWWVLADVFRAVGLSNLSTDEAVRWVSEDNRGVYSLGCERCGGATVHLKANIVNDLGLYRILMRIDTPETRAFLRVVADVATDKAASVLHAERDSGTDGSDNEPDKEHLIDVLSRAAEKIIRLNHRIAELEEENDGLREDNADLLDMLEYEDTSASWYNLEVSLESDGWTPERVLALLGLDDG